DDEQRHGDLRERLDAEEPAQGSRRQLRDRVIEDEGAQVGEHHRQTRQGAETVQKREAPRSRRPRSRIDGADSLGDAIPLSGSYQELHKAFLFERKTSSVSRRRGGKARKWAE